MKRKKKIGLVVGCLLGILCLGLAGIMVYKKMNKTYSYSYHCVKTSYAEQNPRAMLIKSPAELQKCFETDIASEKGLDYFAFRQSMRKYNKKYFEDKMLVLVLLGDMNAAIRPEVKKVCLNKQNKLEIQIDKIVPKESSKDWSHGWYLFVDIKSNTSVTEEDINVVLGEEIEENLVYTMHFPNGTPWPLEGNEAWDLINSMYLNRLEYQKAEECKCEPEYTIEIKSDLREERYEIHLEEGIVCSKKGQAYLGKESLEYQVIEEGILTWRYAAKMNGIQPDTSHLGFSVQYVYTGSNSNYTPKATFIRSVEELQQYFDKTMVREDGEECSYAERFRNTMQKFDEEYFKRQVLVIVEKGDSSGSIRHDVTGVFKNQDGELEIVIETVFLGDGTADVAGWHFFIEIAEEMKVKGDEKIKVVLDGEVVEYPVLTMKCPDGTTYFCEGQHAFWMESELFRELNFRKEDNSVWIPEYVVTIESDVRHEVYEIHLTEGWVLHNGKCVSLDDEKKAVLADTIEYWMHYMKLM